MNKISIKKVGVIGSGIMGSRIACHLANVGLEVILLDIPPKKLNEKEKKLNLAFSNGRIPPFFSFLI